MREATIQTIQMIAKADPECTDEVLAALARACQPQPQPRSKRREMISSREARELLGVNRVTMCKWVAAGKIHPARLSRNYFRYDRQEIEDLAYGGMR